jgi:hypothetical protein
MEPQRPPLSRIRRSFSDPACALADLRIADKTYGIVGLLVIVMTLLMVMSIQTVRLQSQYRRALVDRSRRSKAIC